MSAVQAVAAPRRTTARPAGVTVRFSQTAADIEQRVELARRAWEEMGDRGLSFDGELVRQTIERKMAQPGKHCLLQADRAGRAIGALMGVAAPHYHSPALGASIFSWYVLPEHRGSLAAVKLLHGFRRWAKHAGALRLYVGITSGVDIARTDRLLKKLGFRLTGGNYGLGL